MAPLPLGYLIGQLRVGKGYHMVTIVHLSNLKILRQTQLSFINLSLPNTQPELHNKYYENQH